jgi:hypothetical protein
MNPIDSQQEKIQMLREAYLDPKHSDVEKEVILDLIADAKLELLHMKIEVEKEVVE